MAAPRERRPHNAVTIDVQAAGAVPAVDRHDVELADTRLGRVVTGIQTEQAPWKIVRHHPHRGIDRGRDDAVAVDGDTRVERRVESGLGRIPSPRGLVPWLGDPAIPVGVDDLRAPAL